MSFKRALITGLAGFTGIYMARELQAAGFEVHGLGHEKSGLSNYHQIDLGDLEGLRQVVQRVRPSVVVHLAGIAYVAHADAAAFYRVNLLGTRNLLASLEALDGLDCILLASSANVYGNRNHGVMTEAARPDPANDYAVSKLAMEFMANTWIPRLPIVIARPFNYTGVGQSEDFVISKIVAHFQRSERSISLGNVDVWRDFNDVRSVCSAYAGLLAARPVGRTFNVCSGRETSLMDIIVAMQEIAGYAIDIHVSPDLLRRNEVKSLVGSAQQLKAVVPDWSPIDVQDTLQWMFRG